MSDTFTSEMSDKSCTYLIVHKYLTSKIFILTLYISYFNNSYNPVVLNDIETVSSEHKRLDPKISLTQYVGTRRWRFALKILCCWKRKETQLERILFSTQRLIQSLWTLTKKGGQLVRRADLVFCEV